MKWPWQYTKQTRPARCGCEFRLTDKDLPPAARTYATHWQAMYFEALAELNKANKGIRRLRKKLDRLKSTAAGKPAVNSTTGESK